MKRYVIKSTGELAEHRSGTLITWHDHVKAITAVEAERDRLRVWLREISDLDPKNLYSGYDAVRLAQSALQEGNDE